MGEDHIDRFLERIAAAETGLDLDVEGIVDRIGGLHRRFKNALRDTLADHGLTPEDWHVMTPLRLDPAHRSSPGVLAADSDLSSGAMTSRLDRLERMGLVRRLPDPSDRRSVLVELTDEGVAAWDAAADIQGRKEAFFASALTKKEQRALNDALRKLMLAFEEREVPTKAK